MNVRSRKGCAACLVQHKKCDEARPSCGRCVRLATDCDYKRNLRWFNGTKLRRTRHGSQSGGRCVQSSQRSRLNLNSPGHHATESPTAVSITQSPTASLSPGGDVTSHARGHEAESPAVPLSPGLEELDLVWALTPTTWWQESVIGMTTPKQGHSSPSIGRGVHSPRGHDRNTQARTPQGPVQDINSDADVELGQIVSWQDEQVHAPLTLDRSFINGDLCCAAFRDGETQGAFTYFVHTVALILPAFSGARNGYQQLAMLALSSPMLLDTIASVSTTYMYLRGMVTRSAALRRQSHALASLRKNVNFLAGPVASSSTTMDDAACLKRDVLASILLQITIEIANGTDVVQSHITSAFSLFKELAYDRAKPSSAVGLVLVQRMTYIDVLSSIFWHRRPLLPPTFWYYHETEYLPDSAMPSLQETSGCPFSTMTILARIAHLSTDMEDGVDPDLTLTRGYEIDRDLITTSRDTMDIQLDPDSLNTSHLEAVGQCYHWSAAILLQRRIFFDARNSLRTQYCLRNLIRVLDSLPAGCGPDTQLSLPLYVAALAATSAEHRDFIKKKNVSLTEKYPMGSRSLLTAAFDMMWSTADAQPQESDHEYDMLGRSQAPSILDVIKEKKIFMC